MLTGLLRPDAGSASVDGVELRGDGTAIRKRCSYAPGEIALYGELHGREHLDWFLRGREREARTRARAIADSLALPLKKRVQTYSHGMKRQLVFAAALAPRVPVRILDEPSDGLDPNKRSVLIELLEADARAHDDLLSSHHLDEVDRVVTRSSSSTWARRSASRARPPSPSARRLVRITFCEGGAQPGLAAALARLKSGRATLHGSLALVELEQSDPREFWPRSRLRGLPAPVAIEYGRTSLQDLYRARTASRLLMGRAVRSIFWRAVGFFVVLEAMLVPAVLYWPDFIKNFASLRE
jgi:ABC-type transport system involved in cytochrome c biogenesis ATPase subunit